MPFSDFLAVCLNPTLQKTLYFDSLARDTVNRTNRHRLDASGKGVNVARVLRQLGKRSVHLTHLGGILRPLFLELCEADGLELRWVDSRSPIRFCYTAIDASDRSVTELVEEAVPVSAGTEPAVLDAFEGAVEGCGTLIVSGTKASGYSDSVVPAMVERAKRRGLRVILDVRGGDLKNSLPLGVDIVKPNLHEFIGTYLPDAPSDEAALRRATADAALDLCRRYSCRVVLTRGAASVWVAEDGDFYELEFPAVPPVNTTGSGDAFTAGLAAALSEGASLRAAVAEGARCGRLNAGFLKPGTIVEDGDY